MRKVSSGNALPEKIRFVMDLINKKDICSLRNLHKYVWKSNEVLYRSFGERLQGTLLRSGQKQV